MPEQLIVTGLEVVLLPTPWVWRSVASVCVCLHSNRKTDNNNNNNNNNNNDNRQ